LRILARTRVEGALRARLDPSDLVRETLLEAYRDFPRFAGGTEKELMAWLRRILVRNLADQVKRHHMGPGLGETPPVDAASGARISACRQRLYS
jgi:DNA-directed RNA polymerase specialized sigma24 family protein